MNENPVIKQLFDHETFTYTYLAYDKDTKEGVIIDPVKEQFERDIQLIEELGIELKYVLDTHVHADHITSSGMIKERTGAQIVLGSGSGLKIADKLMEDGEKMTVGNFDIQALATPGHTDGCTSYYVDGAVFTGDALFIRGCGRTDFQQGSPEKLYKSIHEKIYPLPDETLVLPGHDYKGRTVSTVAEEKKHNPRLKLDNSLEDFSTIMKNLKLAHPKKIQEALPANKKVGLEDPNAADFFPKMTMVDLYQTYQEMTPNYDAIIDVRSPEEFAEAHVPGAINIPMGEEKNHLEKIKSYQNVYLHCRSGRRAQTVFATLKEMGINNMKCVNTTGMQDWIQAGYPTEK